MLLRGRRNRLQIQTIHTSKGLEFAVVFLCSLNYEHPDFGYKNPYSVEFATDKLDCGWGKVEKDKEELRTIYTALTRSSHYSYVSNSLHFQMPSWLRKSQIKEHPQFKFLREHAKFYGVIPYRA
jgi:ATP-dependent exoDNAse (exonuclease V) beta subunit